MEGTAYSANTYISPDGRYLVIARANIRVWDISNPSTNLQERDPIGVYAGPCGIIVSARFIDNTTIEVTTVGGNVSQWDITAGAQVGG